MAGRSGDAGRATPALSMEALPTFHVLTSKYPQTQDFTGASAPVFSGFVVELPLPPSVNNLFFNGPRGRVRSQEYRAWIHEAGWRMKDQRPAPVEGWHDLFVEVPLKMRGDNDNRFKAINDLLKRHGLIADDRFQFFTGMMRSAGVPHGQCRVRVTPRDQTSATACHLA